MNQTALEYSFWDHVEELRRLLLKMMAIIFIGFVCILAFRGPFFSFILEPVTKLTTSDTSLQVTSLSIKRYTNLGQVPLSIVPHGTDSILLAPGASVDHFETTTPSLSLLGPTEGLRITLKVAFWASVVLTAPLSLYLILQFILPALHAHESKPLIGWVILSTLFLTAGIAFAFFAVIPLSNKALYAFNAEMGTNLWSMANYLDYTVMLTLAMALAFELSLLFFFLVHYRVLSVEGLVYYRRHAIVLIFIVAALLTPPDVLSQLFLAIPLWIFFEGAILYGRLRGKKKGTH